MNEHNQNNKECDYGKVIGGFHIDDCFCPVPTLAEKCKHGSFKDNCREEETPSPSLAEKPVEKWIYEFRQEFGIHFSPSELQFAEEFIRETILSERKALLTEILAKAESMATGKDIRHMLKEYLLD